MRGLYIHIPFCAKKCDYCDFYSLDYREKTVNRYIDAALTALGQYNCCFDTVYFGGGTPSIIGAERIARLLGGVRHTPTAEITVECNPNTAGERFMQQLAAAGVNRVSIGCQSANEEELRFLTRRHTAADVSRAVCNARAAGIENISLDLMLGIRGQSEQSLAKSIDFCAQLRVSHISAYMLILEQGTPMYSTDIATLPDEEQTAQLYLSLCERLAALGYKQYEISNFAKDGCESRHNLLYWNSDEYVGIGPAAHSFINGRRCYYPRDLEYFIEGRPMIDDGEGGGFAEYAMLRLRLTQGLDFKQLVGRGYTLPDGFIEKCRRLSEKGLGVLDERGFRLNTSGFLVQNLVLGELL